MEKEYKGHKITLGENGKFQVTINGDKKSFASLKSAENAIDKNAVVDFKPVEVLMIEESGGYHQTAYKVVKVKLVEYGEEKVYRGGLRRFFKTDGGARISIGHGYGRDKVYPVSCLKELTELAKERTAIETLVAKSEKRSEKIGERWEKLVGDFDPRPDTEK